ncbi:unnamed protein product, partial [Prorocentrum cordatum]
MVDTSLGVVDFGRATGPRFPGISASCGPEGEKRGWDARVRRELDARGTAAEIRARIECNGGVRAAVAPHSDRSRDLMPGYADVRAVYACAGFQPDATSRM